MVTGSAITTSIAEFFFFHFNQLHYGFIFWGYVYYLGKDAGQLYIKGICSSLEDTIEIDDLFYYDTDVNTFIQKTYNRNTFLFSDYTLPNNHEITVKFKNTPNLQITCGDYTHITDGNYSWIYAWGVNDKKLYTRDSIDGVVPSDLTYTLNKDLEYKIKCNNNVIQIYVNDILITSKTTYDVQDITRLLRLYPVANKNNIEYIKVHEL